MTNYKIAEKPLLVLLHAFGSSRNAWRDISPHFEEAFDVFAPDLPGFGSAAGQGARSVGDIAEHVGREGWIVAGHSMGGKFATILASGKIGGLSPARGVLLLAGSPASPEPMGEDRRAQMIGWAAAAPLSALQRRAGIAGAPTASDGFAGARSA